MQGLNTSIPLKQLQKWITHAAFQSASSRPGMNPGYVPPLNSKQTMEMVLYPVLLGLEEPVRLDLCRNAILMKVAGASLYLVFRNLQ